MRYLFALLLLACTTGHTAAVICPDGLAWVDNNTALCPVNSTTQSVLDITQTTASISATADAQAAGSTGYHWTSASQFPAGCTSLNYAYADLSSATTTTRQAAIKARQKCMNWKTMVAGTGAVSYGSAAISVAGIYTVPITGLTAGTTYYTQHFVMGGVGGAGKVGVLSTQSFATNSSGASPGETLVADTGAAPRYIGTGGNDASDGLTHATRWLTLGKVTGAFPTGTNVGLFNTSVFTTQELRVSHTGTSLDYNIVGSYKLNGSSVPIWTVDGVFGISTTDQKAEIRGGLTTACLDAGSCDFSGTYPADTVTSSQYDPYLQVQNTADYTEIRNIKIALTRYRSAIIGDGYPKTLLNIIVDGLDMENVGDHTYMTGVTNGVWRNSTSYNVNACKQQRGMSGSTGSTASCAYAGWPGGIAIISSDKVLIEYNSSYDTFGEAYNAYNGNRWLIFRNNLAGDHHSICLYTDSSDYTVAESNRCISNVGSPPGRASGEGFRGGIWFDYESYGSGLVTSGELRNHVVRNNLIVNTGIAVLIGIWAETVIADPAQTIDMSGYVYGNTIINSTSTDEDQNSYRDTGTRLKYWHSRNNAHWSVSLGTANCLWRYNALASANYNHWYAQPADTDCRGANDTTPGAPTRIFLQLPPVLRSTMNTPSIFWKQPRS